MRVLLLFPMKDGQTGPAIKRAFENLGHKVKAVDAKIESFNSYNTACHFMPDLIFCSRTHQLTKEVEKIKKKFEVIKICMWNVDIRPSIDFWKHLFPLVDLCDYHFVVNEKEVDQWNKRFKTKTFWLPQGLQDEIYKKPENITKQDIKKYSCDVSFAGNLNSPERVAFIKAARQVTGNVKIWGNKIGDKLFGDEHNKMAFLSKINLGISRTYANINKCVSVRDYKIMGAGGFLLEHYRKGLYELFPFDAIDSYRNPNELKDQIKNWLHHEKERKAFAETGYKFVHERATYSHRIQTALEYIRDN